VALVDTTAVEVAVDVPAALVALVTLELAQVAAPGRAAVVQGAPVAVERLGDDGCVVVVSVHEAGDGEEDEEGHEKEVAGGAGGEWHSWGHKTVVSRCKRVCVASCARCLVWAPIFFL
jgi:hypothetical protein